MSKKKNEKNVLKLVRKSNDLVEARYKFDIWETRIFTKMLTMVRRDDKDFQNYRIYLKDVVRDFQLESNNDAYDRLRAGGMKLMSKVVKVVRPTDEGLMELNTPIVVGMEHLIEPNKKVEDAKFIDISFHPKMKPYLLSLQSHFTTYDVRNILRLPSSYSIRIYELLKQYQTIGRRKFLVQELKEVIGVIEEIDVNGKKKYKDNYPLYGNFKQRVLLKAQRDLKKYTDISFTFDQIKKGRAVSEIIFHISANKPQRVEEDKISHSENNDESNDALVLELHGMVKKWVSLDTVKIWVGKHSESQIRKGINYTLSQVKAGKNIPNVGGYLQTMVKKDDLVDSTQVKKKAAVEKRKKEEEAKQMKAQVEESLRMLQSEYVKEEDKIISKLLEEHPDAKDELIEAVKTSWVAKYNDELSEEENMKNPMVRASYRNVVKKFFPEAFEEVKLVYESKMKKLKIEISKV